MDGNGSSFDDLGKLIQESGALEELGEVPDGFFDDEDVRLKKWGSLSPGAQRVLQTVALSVAYGFSSWLARTREPEDPKASP
jgi:hypothetical protein